MARLKPALVTFNRGLVSRLGLARVDIDRVALSASTMVNWIPRVLGAMGIRVGWSYLGATASNAAAKFFDFIFSTTDTALVEFTDSLLRVWDGDALVTRALVSTAVSNGTFTSTLTGWTDSSDVGGTVASYLGIYASFASTGGPRAVLEQQVTVAAADQGVTHALRIIVVTGPITLRVGSTSGDDDYVTETSLGTGTHSIAFTPTGDFHIWFQSVLERTIYVDSCTVEASGTLTLPTPYTSAHLDFLRKEQSGDVFFLACDGLQQRKVERRSNNSWSIVLYEPEDGPFLGENVGPITMTASALSGDITLTASQPYFDSLHAGALFYLTSASQTVQVDIVAENTFSDPITVTGISPGRAFTVVITGISGDTVTLQQSVDSSSGPWTDYATYTADTTVSVDDTLDNLTVYYRIGVKTGDYVAGTISASLVFPSGAITGVVRVTSVPSSTSALAQVLSNLGSTDATDVWAEGKWSDYQGWPTSVALHEGRLWWAGRNGVTGSVSDAYDSFAYDYVGDAGPIDRTIGSGPVDVINWIVSLQRLILGAQGSEFSARASSLDEILTPTNFNLKACSTQGSAGVAAVKIDQNVIFADRSKARVYQLSFTPQQADYSSEDLTVIVPDLGAVGIARMAVQRKPDTRIHAVLTDGTVMMGLIDPNENVLAWFTLNTDGSVEDVVVLPAASGTTDDQVYYVVKRTINGSTVRYLEKWAQENTCTGGTLTYLADASVVYSGSATTNITGLSHLEGEDVVVWADGADVGTDTDGTLLYTVSGGAITLATAASNVVVGLRYTAQFQSTKLAYVNQGGGSQLSMQKRINHLGLVLADTHSQGLQYGTDFTNLRDLPQIEQGTTVSGVHTAYEEQPIEFDGTWSVDSRLCLQARAPRPATVLAAIIDMEAN